MRLVFADAAREDYLWWRSSGNEKGLARVNALIRAAPGQPFRGIGKPEPLKGNLKGWWSRRITDAHRFVYRLKGKGDAQGVQIAQRRYDY